jgi:hypothetical protein
MANWYTLVCTAHVVCSYCHGEFLSPVPSNKVRNKIGQLYPILENSLPCFWSRATAQYHFRVFSGYFAQSHLTLKKTVTRSQNPFPCIFVLLTWKKEWKKWMMWGSHGCGYEQHYLLGYNTRLVTWYLTRLLRHWKGGGDMSLRNVSWLSTDYTALYPTR